MCDAWEWMSTSELKIKSKPFEKYNINVRAWCRSQPYDCVDRTNASNLLQKSIYMFRFFFFFVSATNKTNGSDFRQFMVMAMRRFDFYR